MRQVAKLTACLALLLSAASWALVPPKHGPSAFANKAFFTPDLYLPITNVPLQDARERMSSLSTDAWDDFFARNGTDFNVYLDMRTGAATSIQGSIPLIPGTGVGNKVSLSDLRQSLGRTVSKVDEAVVADLIVRFIADNSAALGVNPLQLGEPRVTKVTDVLWHVFIPQQYNGVPVRHGQVVATINHGNLVLIGTESWSNVSMDTKPAFSSEHAIAAAGDYMGLYETPSSLWKEASLEIVPMTREGTQNGQSFIGNFGQGYEHRLVWTYGFQRDGETERWQVSVDANKNEVLALEDKNAYFEANIQGGIYPTTNIEVCADNTTCGTMQPNSPMPWADTGFEAPNNFTNGAGVYDYTEGTATTTLNGQYVRISDNCGAITFSSEINGNINMGGVTGHHDCVTDGGGAGNTAASRSAFYELNKLAQQARGWLPNNTWLQSQLTANVNINSTCNAFWNGSTVNFYRSGGGCRNTGEIGAVFDHEWGHGIDDFDSNGTLSSSSEGYADIAAVYRLQTSCVGYGFFQTVDSGCGQTPDGTGFNADEAQQGTPWCDTQCSGVRDTDWTKMVPNTPATPQNFNCSRCGSGTGPCGKQVHCAASPARQAAWDLVVRDLTAAPYNYDSNTAFIVANRIFYQGSGLVSAWHGCDCTAGTADGCGSTNAYMQWLAADDDNGNLSDGTPHMTAIYNAFNRHNIACSTPTPVTNGCATGPTTTPQAIATPGQSQIELSWSSVPNATQYWVLKTEGFAGCDFGKARIANVPDTTYLDTDVANGREYCYTVVAASSEACQTKASTCTCVTPACEPPSATPILGGPDDGTVDVDFTATLDWNDLTDTTYDVQVATDPDFANVVRSATSLQSSEWAMTPALAPETLFYWRVRARSLCGGAGTWSPPRSFTTRPCFQLAVPSLTGPADGSSNVSYTPNLDWGDVSLATHYEVEVSLDSNFTQIVRSATDLTDTQWTVAPALTPNTTYYWRSRALDSCGQSGYRNASFTTANICTPSYATYNSTFKTPACMSASCGCDTHTLVRGRGKVTGGGFEANYSNTLSTSATCNDGNSGVYRADESIDKLKLSTADRGLIVPGKEVRLDVTAYCRSSTDKLDLYYTTDANAPAWTALVTSMPCAGSGLRTFTHMFTVGDNAGAHALRAQLRYGGLPSTCSSGSYNDRDDLVFTVAAPFAQVK